MGMAPCEKSAMTFCLKRKIVNCNDTSTMCELAKQFRLGHERSELAPAIFRSRPKQAFTYSYC